MSSPPLIQASALRLVVALWGCSFANFQAFAGLEFEIDHLTHEATFDETAFEGAFEFVVSGDQPVVIKKLSSSCGCTVPSLEKQAYLPGERDIVRAIFSYGSRTGPQHKTIYVETNEGTIELSLSVQIPVKWSSNTRSLFWQKEEQRVPKELVITFNYGLPISYEGVEHLLESFDLVATETRNTGSVLVLQIAPKDVAPTGIHRAEVTVRTVNAERITIPVYLRAL